MKIYAAYYNPNKTDEELMLVRQGFAWEALIFHIFWVLYKKLWIISLIVVFLQLLSTYNNSVLVQSLSNVWPFAIFIFADDLVEFKLEKAGYRLKRIIIAKSEIEAELKFYS